MAARESTRHRNAFDEYVRLGSRRSLKLLRESLAVEDKPPALSTLEQWSSRYRWQERIAEIEREAREREDAERGAKIRERIERQQRESVALQAKGIALLGKINAGGEDDPALLAVALRYIEVGVRMERHIHGDVPERTEQAEQPDAVDPALKRFSTQELEQLALMLERKQEEAGAV